MPAIPPSPAEAPELWDAFPLGANTFPPRYPGAGRVKVTCDGGAEVTQIKANGKDGASTKFKGRKVTDVTFEVSFPRTVWKEAMAYYMAIDPQAAGYGKIWETVHPACAMRGANKVLVETLSGIVTTGDMHTFTGKGSGWSVPDKPKGSGTTTPKKAEKWIDMKPQDSSHVYYTTPSGSVIDMGAGPVTYTTPSGQVYGFEGPNGPKADP